MRSLEAFLRFLLTAGSRAAGIARLPAGWMPPVGRHRWQTMLVEDSPVAPSPSEQAARGEAQAPAPLGKPPTSGWTGKSVRDTARAFVRAFGSWHTFHPVYNPWFLFGFLWGLPVPVVILAVHAAALNTPFTVDGLVGHLAAYPWHAVFLLHPLLFAAVFGAMGSVALARRRRIHGLVGKLGMLATTDGLTRMYNHRCFQEHIRAEAERARREKRPVCLIMADLDMFKRFNDTWGHPAGDRLLVAVADCMRSVLRPYDPVYRYGGEEFAVLLPNHTTEQGTRVAERLREATEQLRLRLLDGQLVGTTMSLGVSAFRPAEGVSDWIERTDGRLYRAKAEGRNRVCSSNAPPP